jgi:lysophospholipase L1-like esterase
MKIVLPDGAPLGSSHDGSPGSKGPRGTLRSSLLLGLLSWGVALAGAELAARVLFRETSSPVRFAQAESNLTNALQKSFGYGESSSEDGRVRVLDFPELFVSHPELFWTFTPNTRLPDDHWPLFGVLSNGQHLREDHEIPVTKPAGEIRILFIGDSCTFGFLEPHTETVSHLLGEAIRSRYPDLKVETLNAGAPAYTLFQGWRFLETEGMRFQPDLVVVNFGWNSGANWDGRSDLEHYAWLKASQPPGVLAHSRLCQKLWKLLHPAAPASEGDERRPRLLRKEFKALLEKVNQTTKRHGADMLVLVGAGRANAKTPAFSNPYLVDAFAFGNKLALEPGGGPGVVDVRPVIQEMSKTRTPSELFHDAIHPTAITNREITRRMLRKLGPWVKARRAD